MCAVAASSNHTWDRFLEALSPRVQEAPNRVEILSNRTVAQQLLNIFDAREVNGWTFGWLLLNTCKLGRQARGVWGGA
jgi:hypothetical protein